MSGTETKHNHLALIQSLDRYFHSNHVFKSCHYTKIVLVQNTATKHPPLHVGDSKSFTRSLEVHEEPNEVIIGNFEIFFLDMFILRNIFKFRSFSVRLEVDVDFLLQIGTTLYSIAFLDEFSKIITGRSNFYVKN